MISFWKSILAGSAAAHIISWLYEIQCLRWRREIAGCALSDLNTQISPELLSNDRNAIVCLGGSACTHVNPCVRLSVHPSGLGPGVSLHSNMECHLFSSLQASLITVYPLQKWFYVFFLSVHRSTCLNKNCLRLMSKKTLLLGTSITYPVSLLLV